MQQAKQDDTTTMVCSQVLITSVDVHCTSQPIATLYGLRVITCRDRLAFMNKSILGTANVAAILLRGWSFERPRVNSPKPRTTV